MDGWMPIFSNWNDMEKGKDEMNHICDDMPYTKGHTWRGTAVVEIEVCSVCGRKAVRGVLVSRRVSKQTKKQVMRKPEQQELFGCLE